MTFIFKLDLFFCWASNTCIVQGAELMSKHGINVPKGVAVGSAEEVKKAIKDVFPNEKEVYLFFSMQNIIFLIGSM